MDRNERNIVFSSKDIDFIRSWSFNSRQTFQLSSFSKCIRLASKYVTSPENQPRSQPSTSSLRLFLALRLPPTSTFLAKPRCNLTQPSRNTFLDPPTLRVFALFKGFSFFFFLSIPPVFFSSFYQGMAGWIREGYKAFLPTQKGVVNEIRLSFFFFFSLVQSFYRFVTLYARIWNFHNNLIIHWIFCKKFLIHIYIYVELWIFVAKWNFYKYTNFQYNIFWNN